MLKIAGPTDLMVGDVGFYTIAGRVGGWVTFGQAMCDVVDAARGRVGDDLAWFTHAFLVIEVGEDYADIIEAMPKGARIVRLRDSERFKAGYGYARLPLTDAQRGQLQRARIYSGVPYGWLDYLSLALLHAGLPRTLTKRRVSHNFTMICSQLVDRALCELAEYKLFTDGRISGDVTPGALFRRCGAVGDVMWW